MADATEALGKRFDVIAARMDTVSTAEQERKWRIKGVYPDGKKLEFSVLAFDHSDAKTKAEKRKGGAKITDIVLVS
jgi:predicted ester cyclase